MPAFFPRRSPDYRRFVVAFRRGRTAHVEVENAAVMQMSQDLSLAGFARKLGIGNVEDPHRVRLSPSYSRRPLACVSFGGGMIADARVLSAFHRLTTGTFTNALEG